VGVLYATVRRCSRGCRGWLAGACGAHAGGRADVPLQQPDALLVLLLTLAGLRARARLEGAGTRWLVLAGALVGSGS